MERDLGWMYSLVKEIFGFINGSAQEMEIGEVERRLLGMVMEIGRQALTEFVEAKGTGYEGQEILNSEGVRLPYVRNRDCVYRSIFGTLKINRAYYQATGEQGVFPLDGTLNLPERGYSYLMQEIASKLAVNGSYEKACEVFGDIFPVALPIRSLEQVVAQTRGDVARYYESKSPLDTPPEAVVTVATLDKKGFVIGTSATFPFLHASYVYLIHFHRPRNPIPARPNHCAAQLV